MNELMQDIEYASFDRRMIAWTIDIAIITICLTPIMNILSYFIYGDTNTISNFFDARQNRVDAGELWEFIVANSIVIKFLFIQCITFMLMAVFIIGFWLYKDATPGKLLTKCNIIDVYTGGKPSFKCYVARFLCYGVSILPLCLGFFFPKFTKKRQALHDMIVGTAVVFVGKKK